MMSKVDVYRHLIHAVLLQIITHKYFKKSYLGIFSSVYARKYRLKSIFFQLNLESKQTYVSKTTESVKVPIGLRTICMGKKYLML